MPTLHIYKLGSNIIGGQAESVRIIWICKNAQQMQLLQYCRLTTLVYSSVQRLSTGGAGKGSSVGLWEVKVWLKFLAGNSRISATTRRDDENQNSDDDTPAITS